MDRAILVLVHILLAIRVLGHERIETVEEQLTSSHGEIWRDVTAIR